MSLKQLSAIRTAASCVGALLRGRALGLPGAFLPVAPLDYSLVAVWLQPI